MRRVIDLTGQRFGRWTVLSQHPERNKYGQIRWNVLCDCGNEGVSLGGTLRTGNSQSCGCLRDEKASIQGRGKFKDYSGLRFGRLLVLGRSGSNIPEHGRRVYYECRCDCGNVVSVANSNLRPSGHTKSCGCLQRDVMRARYGHLAAGWKNGRHVDGHGYVKVLMRDHPNANQNGYVSEHVLVMSEIIGRPLVEGENVHHKNGQRADNRPENLELWLTKGAQPAGQRIVDLLDWARWLIREYEPVEEALVSYA